MQETKPKTELNQDRVSEIKISTPLIAYPRVVVDYDIDVVDLLAGFLALLGLLRRESYYLKWESRRC